jgi:hypothetical protein
MATDREHPAAAAALRRRNLRTGWILAGVALALALSVWYSKLG